MGKVLLQLVLASHFTYHQHFEIWASAYSLQLVTSRHLCEHPFSWHCYRSRALYFIFISLLTFFTSGAPILITHHMFTDSTVTLLKWLPYHFARAMFFLDKPWFPFLCQDIWQPSASRQVRVIFPDLTSKCCLVNYLTPKPKRSQKFHFFWLHL